MGYILGVDGGNTKTDYFLFDTDVNFIGFYHSGTVSHEALKDSFDGSYRVMKIHLDEFLSRYNLTPKDIDASCFGMAGIDVPLQKTRFTEEVLKPLGFKNFVLVNDAFLGIKAGTTSGVGVCSVNGTGTSNGGIDRNGNYLQVGGIGNLVCDTAGGHYIACEVIRAVFSNCYRCGKDTSLKKIVFDLLDVKDKYYLMDQITNIYKRGKVNYTLLTIACFEEANKGEEVAINILKNVATSVALSASGVANNLDFDDVIEFVMAGSVWIKGVSPVLVDTYIEEVKKHVPNKTCKFTKLMVPPATGAVIWALELYMGAFPNLDIRNTILKKVEEQLDNIK